MLASLYNDRKEESNIGLAFKSEHLPNAAIIITQKIYEKMNKKLLTRS